MPDEPWQVLADLVRQRREERHLSQQQLGVAARTTGRLISDIERAARTNYEPATLRAVARALGWTQNSINDVLAGGRATEAEPSDDDDLRAVVAELRERLSRVEAALEDEHARRRA